MKGRIGTSTRLFSVFGGIKCYNRKVMEIYRLILKASNNQIAMFRAKIPDFADKYSVEKACDAYEVSGATIFRWKKARKEKGGSFLALISGSCAPINKRLTYIRKNLKPSPIFMEVPNEFVLLPFLSKKSQMLWTSTFQ